MRGGQQIWGGAFGGRWDALKYVIGRQQRMQQGGRVPWMMAPESLALASSPGGARSTPVRYCIGHEQAVQPPDRGVRAVQLVGAGQHLPVGILRA